MVSQIALIDAYVAGPRTARDAVAGMSREQLVARPIPGKWSTLEVICHLADSDVAYAHRIKCVIAEEKPLLTAYDENRFVEQLAYQERDLEEELAVLEQTRRQLARILRNLPAGTWKRVGLHTERGLVSVEQLVEVMTAHIPHHVKFIGEKRKALGIEDPSGP